MPEPNDTRSLLDLSQEFTYTMANIREGLGLQDRPPVGLRPGNYDMIAGLPHYGTDVVYHLMKHRDDLSLKKVAWEKHPFNHTITDRVRLEPPVRRSRYELLMLDEDWFAPGVL